MSVPASAYRAAIDARDPAALGAACAPDAVFRSPITNEFHFHGPAELENLYRTALEIHDEQYVVDEYGTDEVRFVQLRARIGRVELDELQLVKLDGEGRVREVTMFVRPLAGLAALAAAIGPALAGQRAPWRARVLAAMSRPLAFLTRAGDKPAVRLVRPGP